LINVIVLGLRKIEDLQGQASSAVFDKMQNCLQSI